MGVVDTMAIGTRLHGTIIRKGSVCRIDKRCYADGCVPEEGEGIKWLHIVDGSGWVPEVNQTGTVMVEQQHGGIATPVNYPQTFGGNKSLLGASVAWAVGTA